MRAHLFSRENVEAAAKAVADKKKKSGKPSTGTAVTSAKKGGKSNG